MAPNVESRFGAPVAVIHRADLQRVLLDAVIASGCKVLTNHTVVDTDQQFSPVSNKAPTPLHKPAPVLKAELHAIRLSISIYVHVRCQGLIWL